MKNFLLTVAVAALVAFGMAHFAARPGQAAPETARDRVLRTGVLRCGYYVFPPALGIDANTGEKSGFAVDMAQEIAQKLNVKLEWAEEVNFGNMMAALQAGRFDAICTPAWINAAQGREALYTRELLYSPIVAVVRADDARFDGDDLRATDTGGFTLATTDGDVTAAIAADDFPGAKALALPNNSPLQQMFLNVRDGKADMTFTDMNGFLMFDKANPGQLKVAQGGKPMRVFPFAIAVGKGEFGLQNLLNHALTEMLYAGRVEAAVRRHELFKGSYRFVAAPYGQK